MREGRSITGGSVGDARGEQSRLRMVLRSEQTRQAFLETRSDQPIPAT